MSVRPVSCLKDDVGLSSSSSCDNDKLSSSTFTRLMYDSYLC